MAQFNKTLSNNSQYRLELVVNYNAYSIPNNTTPVPWTLRVRKLSGSGYWASGTFPWSVNIGGVTSSGSISSYDFRDYTVLNLGSGTATITHDSDGKKKINVSGSFTGASTLGNATASGEMDLPTIPRASSFTLSGSTQTGSAISVAISRASTSFTHRVRWRVGSGSWTTPTSSAGTSASFTVPHSTFPNSTSGTITVAVQTYSGSTAIGNEQTRTRTLTVPTSVVPSFTTISHSEYVSLVNTQIGEYVQNKSRLNLAITGASAGSGASIKSYRITVDGQVANAQSGTTQVIRSSGTLNIIGTVTDSRNRSASKTVEISVLPYHDPTLETIGLTRSTSAGVQDPFGTFARLNIKARVSSLNGKNTATYRVRSRVAPSGGWTTKTSTTSIGISESKTHTYSGYTVTNEYQFEILMTDKLGSQTIMNDLLFLSTGGVPFFVGYDGIASSFGKIPTHGTSYDLEIGEKGLIVDGPIMNSNERDLSSLGDVIRYDSDANVYKHLYAQATSYKSGVDFDTYVEPWILGSGANSPGSGFWYVNTIHYNRDDGNRKQIAYGYLHQQVYTRHRYNGVWNDWRMIGGVDDVVEQGTNYRRWNSGVQECWGREVYRGGTTTATGALYMGPETKISFQANFIEVPSINYTLNRNDRIGFVASIAQSVHESVYRVVTTTSIGANFSFAVGWYAIGRWK